MATLPLIPGPQCDEELHASEGQGYMVRTKMTPALNISQPRIDLALCLGLSAAFGLWIQLTYGGRISPDLASLYIAGRSVDSGQWADVYWQGTGGASDGWRAEKQASGIDVHAHTFLYPPIWPWLISPLAKMLSPVGFAQLFLGLNTVAHLGCALVAWKLFDRPPPLWPWIACAILVVPLTVIGGSAFFYNQPQPLLSFAILLGLERATAGRPHVAAVLFALAASVKVYPALFAVIFVMRGQWTALGTAVLIGAALLGASLAVGGTEANLAFLALLGDLQSKISIAMNNLGLPGVLAHLQAIMTGEALPRANFIPGRGWIRTMDLAMLAGGLALLARLSRRQPPEWWRQGGVPALFIMVSLAMPLAWTHYFTPALCLLPGLFLLLPRKTATLVAVLVLAAHSTNFFAGIAKPASNPGIYPLVGFLTLTLLAVVFALSARRDQRPTAPE
ncbi:glycosyltransferase family 87 protein [Halovulum sp. GXIMD14794]